MFETSAKKTRQNTHSAEVSILKFTYEATFETVYGVICPSSVNNTAYKY